MRNGAAPSMVRVLPAAESTADAPPPGRESHGGLRWLVPALTAAAALLVFIGGTGAGTDLATVVTTTTPPAMSALEPGVIDLSVRSSDVLATNEWKDVSFQRSGQINDLLRFNSSLVAIGSTADGAMAWLSGTGAGWRDVPRLPRPEDGWSSIEHAVVWEGKLIALGSIDNGTGLWTAASVTNWVYHGEIESMEGGVVGLAAGTELVALTTREGRLASWKSSDGIEWRDSSPLQGLDDLGFALTLAGNEDGFYVGGEADCPDPRCSPAIYRSIDGVNWEPAAIELPASIAAQAGTVLDISMSADGFIAVGVLGPFPRIQVAVWTSPDGREWSRLSEREPYFQPAATRVNLVAVSPGAAAGAAIEVDFVPYTVTVGSEVITDAGSFQITDVSDDGIQLSYDGSSWRLGVGGTVNLERPAQAWRVASEGERIAIAGAYVSEDTRIPVVWVSTDSGASWELAELPTDEAHARNVIVRGGNITVAGGGQEPEPIVWHSTWDNSVAEAAGIAAVEAFVDALNRRDIDVIRAAVPQWRDGSTDPIIELPTLGRSNVQWWGSSGLIDVDAVANTMAYLDELGTTIEVGTCTSRLLLGDIESLRVSCGFSATSDLLDLMSSENVVGKMDVTIESGVFQRVALAASPSETLWQYLASGTMGAAEEDRSTIVRAADDGPLRFDPIFTAQTAAVHLRLATAFTEGLLRPGETKVVETALGTMEWQWLEELPVPVYTFEWVVPTDNGFVALGYGEAGRWTEDFSLWSSGDGLVWTQLPAPEGIDSLWDVEAYRGGLVAHSWRDDQAILLTFDGDEWSEIEFPDAAGEHFALTDVAVSGETILAFTGSFFEDGYVPVATHAWLIGPDRVPRPATLPPGVAWEDETLGLVGSDEGFVLATSQFGTARSMSVWHSPSGKDWLLIAQRTTIEDASYVWEFRHHLTEYFVVGEGTETRCATTDEQGPICQQLIGLWSSPDGAAWDQVLTEAGEPIAAREIASGPLGMAAVAMEYYENKIPRPIYLSPDGQHWDRAGNLALVDPDVSWWWLSKPAVGNRVIIIPGAAYDDSSGTDGDVPLLIVGRLVEE